MIRRLKWGNYLKSLSDVRNEISSLEVGHNNVIDTDRSSFHPKDVKDREKYSPGSWRRPRKVKSVLFVCLHINIQLNISISLLLFYHHIIPICRTGDPYKENEREKDPSLCSIQIR